MRHPALVKRRNATVWVSCDGGLSCGAKGTAKAWYGDHRRRDYVPVPRIFIALVMLSAWALKRK